MRSPFVKIRRFLALEHLQQRRFLLALGILSWVTLVLRVGGYRRCRAWLETRLPTTAAPWPQESARVVVELDAWAVRAASEQLPWGSCLSRSLTLWWLLARRGIETEILFGVRRNQEDLAAHAWVEWGDQPLTDPVDPRLHYTSLEAD